MSDTKVIEITSTSFEYSVLGSGDDLVFGDDDRDHISTGGGDDKVSSGAGDDVVVVQGQGDVEVDTGVGDDRVVVDSSFSGTLLIKNGEGNNILEFRTTVGSILVDEEGTLVAKLTDGSEIKSEDYLTLDEVSGKYVVSQKGYGAVLFDEWVPDSNYNNVAQGTPFDFGFGAVTNALVRGSDSTDDLLYAANYNNDNFDEQAHHFIISARDGNDELFAGGGMTTLYGGWGDDLFHISSEAQQTVVVGDVVKSTTANVSGMPTLVTENINYADTVEIGWSYYDSVISSISGGYRIYNEDLAATVDIYDIEVLKFKDDNVAGGWDTRLLTAGQVIDKDSWVGEFAGLDIDYDHDNVRFVIDGNTLKVMADVSIAIEVEEQFETVVYAEYRVPGDFYGYRVDWGDGGWDAIWGEGNYERIEETYPRAICILPRRR